VASTLAKIELHRFIQLLQC